VNSISYAIELMLEQRTKLWKINSNKKKQTDFKAVLNEEFINVYTNYRTNNFTDVTADPERIQE
jgi:hypothetical protein